MQLLDGKKVSEDIKNEIAEEVRKMRENGEKVPHLAAIIVGNDGASLTYVGSKVKACERVGFESTMVRMPMNDGADMIEPVDGVGEAGGTQI